MKKILTTTALAIIILVSCKKDSPTTPTKTTEEILTSKTWKADEVRTQLGNNTTSYYKRGAGGNTVNYDTDSLKFNTNNTGVYYFQGAQYTTTWNFGNAEKTKMTIVISYSPALTVNLEYIDITENSFKYTQFPSSGISYLASATRVPN